ncbi:hypothetical protein N7486_005789 [Penicillium sp. IBT 16267x]|nr:hypothetical protein N7486_005789 [Penicillium sp. IBT 16267x]
MFSPAMETTRSSDGSVYDESAYGYFNQPSYSFTTAPYMGMTNTVPLGDVDWTARNLSFISETEDTPSLSSSFMDMPKEEPPYWDNMPYQTQVPLMPISNEKSVGLQPLNPQFQECSTPWNSWPTNTETYTRNAFLIDCKRRGLSYKEIKRMGGFKEAESTLRGRFRTLTKSKEQRVRKPKWLERDINLLIEAVSIYTDKDPYDYDGDGMHSDLPAGANVSQHQARPPKVSWKKVAQFIWAHGGSYQFGNATCKKKWCEICGVKT